MIAEGFVEAGAAVTISSRKADACAEVAAEAERRLLSEKQPSLAFVTPEQLGACAGFLCSEGAAQIRGAALAIDGGWTAQ